jgi:predicted transcriptional regulator
MNSKINDLLNEASLTSRIEILKILRNGEYKLSDLHRELSSDGVKVPISTVSRALSNMVSSGILKRESGAFYLSPLGLIFIDAIESIEKSMNFEYLDLAYDFIVSLPVDLRFGIPYLTECDIIDNLGQLVKIMFEVIENVKIGGKYIDRVINNDIFKLMMEKNLQGCTEKVISSEDTLIPRLKAGREVINEMGLNLEQIEQIFEMVEIKVLDVPAQLGVIDGEIAIIMFLKENFTSPTFISRDRKVIDWMERVFDYYWSIAKPIEEYLPGGMRDMFQL